jgi:hypothetical protein
LLSTDSSRTQTPWENLVKRLVTDEIRYYCFNGFLYVLN